MMASKSYKKQRGATMVEYALIVMAIALVAYAGAKILGNSVSASVDSIASKITT